MTRIPNDSRFKQSNVTLPEGASLERGAQVVLDAWETEPLLGRITPHVGPTDMRELAKVAAECWERANRLRQGAGSE